MLFRPRTSQDTPTYKQNLTILARFFKKLLIGQANFYSIWTVLAQNDLEGQGQITTYAIPSKNFLRYTFKPNLVIIGTLFQKLLCGQAHHLQSWIVLAPNDLEGQGQMSENAIPSKNFPRCTYKLILGAFFEKLLSGQAKVHRRTYGRMQL